MIKKGQWKVVGKWAFVVGLILAILLGIFNFGTATSILVSIVVILGLIVGLINITEKETLMFLVSSVVLVIVSGFGGSALANVAYLGKYLSGILGTLLMLIVPATIIVCLKEIYIFSR